MILIRCELMATRCAAAAAAATSFEPRTEIVTVTVPARALVASADLCICAIYIHPDSDRIPADVECLLHIIKCTASTNNLRKRYLVIGDFNLPCISWSNEGPLHSKVGKVDIQNAGVMSFLGLEQYNTIKNYAGNTLDLAFSDLPLVINNCASSPIKN